MEDLAPGMELMGTVLNVVPFGAFVDIGVRESGLVHISQMANRYVKSPFDLVAVGDVVTVWVVDIKADEKKVSLTMIAPHAPRQQEAPPQRSIDLSDPSGRQGHRAAAATASTRRTPRGRSRPERLAAIGTATPAQTVRRAGRLAARGATRSRQTTGRIVGTAGRCRSRIHAEEAAGQIGGHAFRRTKTGESGVEFVRSTLCVHQGTGRTASE